MYACTLLCMYACIYIYIYEYTCPWSTAAPLSSSGLAYFTRCVVAHETCVCVRAFICVYIYICVCICVCAYVYMYVCVFVCVLHIVGNNMMKRWYDHLYLCPDIYGPGHSVHRYDTFG